MEREIEAEAAWEECMRKVVAEKKLLNWDYIYDKDFQQCFKSRVHPLKDGILFGDPQMQVSKYNDQIIVIVFNDSDDQACEQCPLNDHPYCELGKIRIELQEYFKEHRYILPKEIIDILVYCKCNND